MPQEPELPQLSPITHLAAAWVCSELGSLVKSVSNRSRASPRSISGPNGHPYWTPGATAWFMGTLQPGASIIPCLDETNEPRPKNRALQHVDCFAMPSNTKNLRTVNVMGNAVILDLRIHSQCSYFVPRIVESHVQPFCFWSCLSRGVTGQPN